MAREILQSRSTGKQIVEVAVTASFVAARRVRKVPGFRDRFAYTTLEHLGKQTDLTPLKDKILQASEQGYGVDEDLFQLDIESNEIISIL